jgi:hypothetical protein
MWSILINIIISIIIIFVCHSLFEYLKNTYSKKKTNDIIGFQIKKLKDMLNVINEPTIIENVLPNEREIISEDEIHFLNDDLDYFIKQGTVGLSDLQN